MSQIERRITLSYLVNPFSDIAIDLWGDALTMDSA